MSDTLIVLATTVSGVFFRAGQKWTREGTLIDPVTYGGDLDLLLAEPHLKVRPASPDEIARLSPVPDGLTEDELIEVLIAEIAGLPGEAFGKDGTPKLPDLRRASAIDADLLTADLRDAAFARMIKAGFEPPV